MAIVEILYHLECALAAVSVYITYGYHFYVAPQKVIKKPAVLDTHADKGHIYEAVGSLFSGPDTRWQDEWYQRGCCYRLLDE